MLCYFHYKVKNIDINSNHTPRIEPPDSMEDEEFVITHIRRSKNREYVRATIYQQRSQMKRSLLIKGKDIYELSKLDSKFVYRSIKYRDEIFCIIIRVDKMRLKFSKGELKLY